MKERVSAVEAFEKVLEMLKSIDAKLDLLVEGNAKRQVPETHDSSLYSLPRYADVLTLLKLPMSLRQTAMVLYRFKKATADEIAKQTGKLRAVESARANELVRIGFINKKREGRAIYFFIEPELEGEK